MNKPDQNSKPAFSGERVRLGDVCQIVSGATPKTGNPEYWNGSIKWITPAELSGNSHVVTDSAKHITDAGFASANLKMLPIGTVLLTTRAPIGKVAITGSEMSCNQGFKNLICSDLVYNEYLFRHLKFRASDLQALGRGATFKELSKRDVENFEIVLPHKERQNEAVEKLSHVEKAKEIASLQITHLQSLVKSRFVEMFGDGRCFQKCKIGDLVCGIVSGTNVSGKQRPLGPDEFGVLKISSVTKGVFDSSEFKVVSDPNSVRKMIYPRKGDLLFSRANTSEMIGATAIVDNDYDQLFLPDKLWRLDPSRNVDTIFLKQLLSSKQIRATLSKISTGTSGSMQNISMSKFRSVDAYLPPLPLQREFAAFAGRAAKLEFVAQQQIEKLQTLYDSLAQEYFG